MGAGGARIATHHSMLQLGVEELEYRRLELFVVGE